MFSPLILHTIVWPFGLGAILAVIVFSHRTNASLQVLVAMAMILAIYTMLEGAPSFPPVAAKQKLSYLIAAIAVAVPIASFFRQKVWLVTILILGIALAWLGANKLVNAAAWPQALMILAALPVAAFASRSLETRANDVFLWPAALMAFAIGASILSLLGFFMGFAQAMGALAAWIGGYMLFQFAVIVMGGKANALAPVTLQTVLLGFVSMSFMVALFAPDVNLLAYAVLSLALLVPHFAPEFRGLSPIVKPFAFGFLAAAPAVAAILVAFVQRGLSVG